MRGTEGEHDEKRLEKMGRNGDWTNRLSSKSVGTWGVGGAKVLIGERVRVQPGIVEQHSLPTLN